MVARALDAAGNPVPAALALEVHGALLTDVAEIRPGEVRGRIAAGPRLQGDEAVVTATAAALGISGARVVPLRPAEAAAGRFEPRAVVRGDGNRVTALRLLVADWFGNPVPALPIVTAGRGRVAGVAPSGPGEFEVHYVGPAVARPEPDSLVARIGGLRATLAPTVAPPPPALRLDARGGPAVDLGGGGGGVAASVGVERPADVELALRSGLEAGLRLEVGGLSGPGGGRATLLAGPSLRRIVGGGPVWGGSATAGLLLEAGEVAPAARLAVSAGLAGASPEPFLELSVLGATAGAPGPFVAAALSVGVRLGVKGSHAHDPDRR